MTFGEYIRKRRKKLKMTQKQVPGFDQGTISKMERGQNPTKREIIFDLATALKLPLNDEYIDWLWMYSMLDRVPYNMPNTGDNAQDSPSEALAVYRPPSPKPLYGGDIEIFPGMPALDVLQQLGTPETKIRLGNEAKWIYKEEGLVVVIENNVVKHASFRI